ncbi:MAG TPA: hypothetical protein PKJ04_06835, partial [Nitrospira sp.]|nr:hypothetical protein [Nitrospira sp.]
MRCLAKSCTLRLPAAVGGLLTVLILVLLTTSSHAAAAIEDVSSAQTDTSLDLPDLSLPTTPAGQATGGKESTLF